MPSKSSSGLSNMFKIDEISLLDKLRLPNKAAISRFSRSRLFIKSVKSRLSKSRPVNFNMDEISDMSNSELFKIAIISGILIEDKS